MESWSNKRDLHVSTKHDNLAKIRSELQAWFSLVGADKRLEQCMRYVASNEDEVAEMVDLEGVRTAADNVIDIASSCHGGKCE